MAPVSRRSPFLRRGPTGEVRGAAGTRLGPRLAAHRLLRRVEEGAHASVAAEGTLAGMAGRDRALAMELAYGCIRLRARLDHEIAHFSSRPLDRLDPGIHQWLRIGLYQLREMRVPAHAAVNETVEGAGETDGRGASGYVNGVLRSAAREDPRSEIFPSLEEDPEEHLVLYGSHPRWLVRRWLDRWPLERVAELVDLDNRPPEVTGRWLTPDGSAPPGATGPETEVSPLAPWPGSFRLEQGEPARLLARAPAVIQDPAASAVVDYLGRPRREPVLDACAAPGGKALVLAATGPAVVAGDASISRLRPVVEAARRAGVRVRPVAMDARSPAVSRAGTVLLDVPCTGTGTLRRRPDLRWRVGPGRLDSVVRLQREILESAAGLVPAGGVLVYSTCSLEPEENEGQVEAFLERHPDYRRVSPGETGLPDDVVDSRGDLRVLPWMHGTDGSYAARLARTGEPR